MNMSVRKQGKVKFFNEEKGFGFVTPNDNSKDVFVHISAVKNSHYDSLSEGDLIEFDVIEGRKGEQADNIIVMN
jgi:CspA family cold shock protein